MLEVVAKGIRQVFEKVGQNALSAKIYFLSPDCLPNQQSLDFALQVSRGNKLPAGTLSTQCLTRVCSNEPARPLCSYTS